MTSGISLHTLTDKAGYQYRKRRAAGPRPGEAPYRPKKR